MGGALVWESWGLRASPATATADCVTLVTPAPSVLGAPLTEGNQWLSGRGSMNHSDERIKVVIHLMSGALSSLCDHFCHL